MIKRFIPFVIAMIYAGPALAAPQILLKGSSATVTTSGYTAKFDGPCLTYFKDLTTGEILLQGKDKAAPFVRLVENGRSVTLRAEADSFTAQLESTNGIAYKGKIVSDKTEILVDVEVHAFDDRIEISSKAGTSGDIEGLASVGVGIGPSAKQTEIIVPHSGGIRFASTGNKTHQGFEWPINWEAAMTQVQGKKGGILVSSFDPFTRFKNLELVPAKEGWNLLLETENQAPFEGQKSVDSLVWTIRPYKGDWRNGAGIYRKWLYETFKPSIKEDATWVKDIRAEIHCGMDPVLLDAIVEAGIDPAQTLLYVPSWRTDEYDRNYPDYTPDDKLAPFMEKAHRMGFHVMLHVNYFGCDPGMPEYERFEKYQFRHKYSGDKLWWWWTRAEPEIKFAYTDPASREWREFFVAKMVELIGKTGADALHLDQTLCIFNDKNGLIDGLNSAQGNLKLHEEMKAALPQVAISGEGLDEVTMIHEAFAQRHAYGIDFVNGTFDTAAIKRRHPLSAYLFGERTTPYQYLGTCSPENSQLYLAWRDFYRVGGVIPGYAWPSATALSKPVGTVKQALDEIKAFQQNKLTPSMEGSWPDYVDFPYKTKSGGYAAYISDDTGWALSTTDDSFSVKDVITRTVTGVEYFNKSGSIPGCITYDSKKIGPLDPVKYYAWSPEPRDMNSFHVEPKDNRLRVAETGSTPDFAWFRTASTPVIAGNPRVERIDKDGYLCRVVIPARFKYIVPSATVTTRTQKSTASVDMRVPADGAVYATTFPPELVEKDIQLTDLKTYDINLNGGASNAGVSKDGPGISVMSVGGVKRSSIDAHPPQNGKRYLNYFLTFGEGKRVTFEGFAGLRDGSKSDGVTFEVRCNGKTLWSKSLKPDSGWAPISVTLQEHTSGPVMLTLVTDSEGNYYYDWALWGEPQIRVETESPKLPVSRLSDAAYYDKVMGAWIGKCIGGALGMPIECWHYKDIEAKYPVINNYIGYFSDAWSGWSGINNSVRIAKDGNWQKYRLKVKVPEYDAGKYYAMPIVGMSLEHSKLPASWEMRNLRIIRPESKLSFDGDDWQTGESCYWSANDTVRFDFNGERAWIRLRPDGARALNLRPGDILLCSFEAGWVSGEDEIGFAFDYRTKENGSGFGPDDDTSYQVVGLHALETYGPDVTSEEIAREWVDHLPSINNSLAEGLALERLKKGIKPPESGNHAIGEAIGGQMKGEIWGLVSPGCPNLAADYAHKDGVVAHRDNGVYGEQFVAAMMAAAFYNSDINTLIDVGLSVIPKDCRYAEVIKEVVNWHGEYPDWKDTRQKVLAKYPHVCNPVYGEAGIVALALLYGGGDFEKSICIAASCGNDTDCNAATVGALIGCIKGAKAIPAKWKNPIDDRFRCFVSGFEEWRISELAKRICLASRKVLEQSR